MKIECLVWLVFYVMGGYWIPGLEMGDLLLSLSIRKDLNLLVIFEKDLISPLKDDTLVLLLVHRLVNYFGASTESQWMKYFQSQYRNNQIERGEFLEQMSLVYSCWYGRIVNREKIGWFLQNHSCGDPVF